MRISVIGCGYLGAVHAAAMAGMGHHIVGVDVDSTLVTKLGTGKAPFFEPGLDVSLQASLASGRLRFTTDFSEVSGADLHFIAVGTPQRAGQLAADLSYLDAAVDSLLPYLNEGAVVVGKSTVPVGTAERLEPRLKSVGAILAWNPEFLREGFALSDTLRPDRLVYGVSEGSTGARACEVLNDVYSDAIALGTPVVVVNYATAELVKSSANAFLATKISFINAMSEIAEKTGADVAKLSEALGLDPRIGSKFLNPGIGFGGGCLSKDIRALSARADELGLDSSVRFLKEVDTINARQRDRLVARVVSEFGGDLLGKKIAFLGLAFKPNSDDVRDSPALEVAVRLHRLGARIVATDPHAIPNSKRLHPELECVDVVSDALLDAQFTIIATEWAEFATLDPEIVGRLVENRVVVDARNCIDAVQWRRAGWHHIALGRPESTELVGIHR